MTASIVKCTLTQLCILTNKEYATNSSRSGNEGEGEALNNQQSPPIPQSVMNKLLRQILLTPGKTVSFSQLSQKGMFRKNVHGYSGKNLMHHLVANILPKVPLGVVQEKATANRIMVYFFVKDDLPEDETSEDTVKLIQHLAKVAESEEPGQEAMPQLKWQMSDGLIDRIHHGQACLRSDKNFNDGEIMSFER
ncbi:Hypothetical predicted protein [Paramuricea clavata]|uniref:Uncharacterized protein n=1 Tax=Paramuricea clavata TaxID=317549 RepID=A0A6S7HWM8_PARCT|nr:Hypothetical predicted protein [Paramuricea clavata]